MGVVKADAVVGSSAALEYQSRGEKNSLEVMRNGIYSDIPKEQHKEMREYENKYQRSNVKNKRLEVVLSPTKDEIKHFKLNTENETQKAENWDNYAKTIFHKQNIDLNQYPHIGHVHGNTENTHLHLKVSLTDFYGENKISPNRIRERLIESNNSLCKEHNLKTAKEIGDEKREKISIVINETLSRDKVKSFDEFKTKMYEKGYYTEISQSENKGIYGMRIIPKDDFVSTPSKKQITAKQGYKLSEIPVNSEQSKTKYKIQNIKDKMEANQELTPQQQLNNKFSSIMKNENVHSFEDFKNHSKTELSEYSISYAHVQEQQEKTNFFSRWRTQDIKPEQEYSNILNPNTVSDIKFTHNKSKREINLSDLKNDKNESYSVSLMQEQMKENKKIQNTKNLSTEQEKQKQQIQQQEQQKYSEFIQKEQNRTFNRENTQDKGFSR